MESNVRWTGLLTVGLGGLALFAAGCECDDGSDGDERDASAPPGDGAVANPGCLDYEPTPEGGGLGGSWEAGGDPPRRSFSVPADPGGGYVQIDMSTTEMEVGPRIVVQAAGDPNGSIITLGSLGTDDPQSVSAVFEARAGGDYEFTGDQASSGPTRIYPVEFTASWSFSSLVDCYEPNDTPEDAREISLGVDVEAYAIAGYTRNGQSNEAYDDWYGVRLDAPGVLEAELVQPPGDHGMGLRIYEAGSTQAEASALQPEPGARFSVSTDGQVPAGRYLVQVRVVSAADGAARATDIPAHFQQPYTLRARVR